MASRSRSRLDARETAGDDANLERLAIIWASVAGALAATLMLMFLSWWTLLRGPAPVAIVEEMPDSPRVVQHQTESDDASGDESTLVEATDSTSVGEELPPASEATVAVDPAPSSLESDQPTASNDVQQPASEDDQVAPANEPEPAEESIAVEVEQPATLSPVQVDERVLAWRLPTSTWTAAYDAHHGRLIVGNDSRGFVIHDVTKMLNGDNEPLTTIATHGKPLAALVKEWKGKIDYLLAGSEPSALAVHDDSSYEVKATLELDPKATAGYLASSIATDDPYVHFAQRVKIDNAGNPMLTPHGGGRIDLTTMSVDRRLSERESFLDLAVSRDGKLLYHRSPNWPTGLRVSHWREGPPLPNDRSSLIVVHSDHRDTPEYVPFPDDPLVAIGRHILNETMEAGVGQLPMEPRAFFRQRPLIAGVGEKSIMLVSANDYRSQAEIPLPDGWFRELKPHERGPLPSLDPRQRRQAFERFKGAFLYMAADDERELLVTVVENHIVLTPLAKLNLPKEPILRVEANVPDQWFVGEETVIPLSVQSGNAQFELPGTRPDAQEQNGLAKLDGNVFRWTPDRSMIGDRRFTIRATSNGLHRDVTWFVNVSYPFVDLPFDGQGVSFSTDGTKLVTWGWVPIGPDPQKIAASRQPKIAIIDVATRKIEVMRDSPQAIIRAVISKDGVHAAVSHGDFSRGPNQAQLKEATQIIHFNRTTLEPEGQSLVAAKATTMQVIADQFLVLSGIQYVRLSDRSIQQMPKGVDQRYGQYLDGWLWQGAVWDSTMSRRRLLVSHTSGRGRMSPAVVNAGEGVVVVNHSGFKACQWLPSRAGSTSQQMQQSPVGVSFDTYGRFVLNENHVSQGMPLLGFSPIRPHAPLTQQQQLYISRNPDRFNTREYGNVAVTQGLIAAQKHRSVFFVPHSDFSTPALPPQFEEEQSTLTLKASGKSSVNYQATNAKAYQLELRHAPNVKDPFVTLESKDGRFVIDLKPHLEQLMQGAQNQLFGSYKVYVGNERAQAFEESLPIIQDEYQEITGVKPKGVPVPVWASVIATGELKSEDPDHIAGLAHFYFVELPMDDVRTALKVTP